MDQNSCSVSVDQNINLSAFSSLIAIATTSAQLGFNVGFDCCLQKGSRLCHHEEQVIWLLFKVK